MYGIISQIRRCAVSVQSNIAEGFGRNSNNDFIRFLRIAVGSLFELQTQIEICFNLNYLDEDVFHLFYESTREVERMLTSLTGKLIEKKSK